MKKLLVLAGVVLSVFLIYLSTIDKKVYYLSLTTHTEENNYASMVRDHLEEKGLLEKYVSEFNRDTYRITDFAKLIENNQTILIDSKEQSIKNALIKADIVSIDVGRLDLFTKLAYESNREVLYDYIDDLMQDMDSFLEKVRLYCKEDIFLLGIYNRNEASKDAVLYMNEKIKVLSQKYKIHFVESPVQNTMVKENFNITEEGETAIFKSLNTAMEKALFHK